MNDATTILSAGRLQSACLAAMFLASSAIAQSRPTTAPADSPARADLRRLGSRELVVHDPSAIVRAANGEHWLFATGNGLRAYRSTDGVRWRTGPRRAIATPAWVAAEVPENRGHLWAPDVIALDGRYLLYYSVSSFGKNHSCIALATNATLDPDDPNYKWIDGGVVVRSAASDKFNAIDPAITLDADGRLWMSFGSFWGGIQLVELDRATGLRKAGAPIRAIAWKEQIEAPAIHRHGDHYYLFVTWGWCCRGVKSTYTIRVGRSESIEGPYVDRDGVELAKGGGTLLLAGDGRDFIGPGHPSVLVDADGSTRLSMHFYDATNGGRGTLAIRPLLWDAHGWPSVGVEETK